MIGYHGHFFTTIATPTVLWGPLNTFGEARISDSQAPLTQCSKKKKLLVYKVIYTGSVFSLRNCSGSGLLGFRSPARLSVQRTPRRGTLKDLQRDKKTSGSFFHNFLESDLVAFFLGLRMAGGT